MTYRESVHQANLEISLSQPQLQESMARHAAACARKVDQFLGLSTPPARKLVIADAEPADLLYRPEENILHLSWRFSRAFAQRRAKELFPEDSRLPAASLDFLAAGCAYLCVRETPLHTVGWVDFSPAQQQFSHGKFPDARKLLCSPVHPDDSEPLFHIYAMHCALLLQLMPRLVSQTPPLLKIMELEAYGRAPEDAVDFVMNALLPPNQSLQDWYRQHAPAAIPADHILQLNSFLVQLRNLQNIPLQNGKTIPLRELPNALQNQQIPVQALGKLQYGFLQLRQMAPPLLREATELYITALSHLISQNSRQYLKTLNKAEQAMQNACLRQQKTHEALLQFEQERIPLLQRLEQAFLQMGKSDQRKEKILPLPTP